MTTKTPLSDRITALVASPTPVTWEAFVNELLRTEVGVAVAGLPAGVTGRYEVRGGELGMRHTRTPDGRVMILACADPATFRQRYPEQGFNADTDARSVLKTVLGNPDCAGVLLNSAASAHSVPVSRAQVVDLLGRLEDDRT